MSNFTSFQPETTTTASSFNQGRFEPQQTTRPSLAGPPMQQALSVQQPAPVAQGRAKTPLIGAQAPNTFVIRVNEQHKFKHGAHKPTEEDKLLTSTPLLSAMQAAGLSTDEGFNIQAVHLASEYNPTGVAWATAVSGVNGRQLVGGHTASGDWHTAVHQPTGDRARSFVTADSPLGLLVAENQLDADGNINVAASPAELRALAQKHSKYLDKDGAPTKYLVPLNLQDWGNPSVPQLQKEQQLNELGKVVFANARGKIAAVPNLERDIGGQFIYTQDDIEATKRTFPGAEIVPDTIAGPGNYTALIPAAEFDAAVQRYGKQVVETAQPSKADAVKHRIVRVHRGASERHTDLSNEANLSLSDLDRMKLTNSGVSSTWNYVIQHNGKPYVQKTS